MIFAAVIFALAFGICLPSFLGMGRLKRLADATPATGPRVSVIIAARDEEKNIEVALHSVLAQDYPDYEVIVIDDRSTDRTGEVLARLVDKVVTIRELPAGWLGKNHALQRGAEMATGEWLLFTDADVVFSPDALRLGVGALAGIDHLTLIPDVTTDSPWLQIFMTSFTVSFWTFARPDKAEDPKSRNAMGIGAFNLLRREDYFRLGGHEKIRMRPDDDMRLGKLVKDSGLRQRVLSGVGKVQVEWYSSVGDLVRGMEKNALAGVDYNFFLLYLSTSFYAVMNLSPLVGLVVSPNWFWAGALATLVALYAQAARVRRGPAWTPLFYPVGVVLFIFILWRASILILLHGGISWRGTHYSLRDLKGDT